MLPELMEHFAAIDAAQADCTKAYDSAPRHDYNMSEETCPRCVALKPSQNALRAAEGAAWSAMRDASDPLLRWIAENCEEYQAAALEVVRALPADMDTLNALAREKDWCGVWDDFKDAARAAGVLGASVGAKAPDPANKS